MHHRSFWALLPALSLAACSADRDVPPGTQIRCETDADCPRGLACKLTEKLCALPGDTGSPPLGLQVVAVVNQNTLQWRVPPAIDYELVRIERAVGAGEIPTAVTDFTASADPGVWVDTPTLADTQYTYRVRIQIAGDLLEHNPGDEVTVWSPPFALEQLTLVPAPASGLTLRMTDRNTNTTGYRLTWRFPTQAVADGTQRDIDFLTDVTSEGSSVFSYELTGLGPESEYIVGVSVLNEGNASTETTRTTWTFPTAPTLTATPTSATSINLQWNDTSANETGYVVRRAAVAPSTDITGAPLLPDVDILVTLPADSVGYADDTAEAGISYHYQVAATGPWGAAAEPGQALERTTALPTLEWTTTTLSDACELDVAGTAAVDTGRGASFGPVTGAIEPVDTVTADADGVRGTLTSPSFEIFDATWRVEDSYGGATTLVKPLQLVIDNGASMTLEALSSPRQQNEQALQLTWSGAEPTTVCTQCLTQRATFETASAVTCAIAPDSTLRCWGNDDYGQTGYGSSGNNTLVPRTVCESGSGTDCQPLSGVLQVSVSADTVCALLEDTEVRCWGWGDSGRLGTGDVLNQVRPTPVCLTGNSQTGCTTRLDGVSAISQPPYGGANQAGHVCALRGGEVWCWGVNNHSQLGDETTDLASNPVQVCAAPGCAAPLTGAVAIATGGASNTGYSCALLSTGGVACWGFNQLNVLGAGAAGPTEPTPVSVCDIGDCSGTLSGVLQIAAGQISTCGVLTDGGVACWGRNDHGERGNGETLAGVDAGPPSRVCAPLPGGFECASYLTDVVSVAAGDAHVCALLSSGEVACWGQGGHGALGSGTQEDSLYPALVCASGSHLGGDCVPLQDVVAISAGNRTTCAVGATGELWCWGTATHGDGTAFRRVPNPVRACDAEGHRGCATSMRTRVAGCFPFDVQDAVLDPP